MAKIPLALLLAPTWPLKEYLETVNEILSTVESICHMFFPYWVDKDTMWKGLRPVNAGN